MKKERITSGVSLILLLEFCFILFLWITRYQVVSATDFKIADSVNSIAVEKNNSNEIIDKKSGEKKLYQSAEKICAEIKNAKTCSDLCRQSLAEENNIRQEIGTSPENKSSYKKSWPVAGRVAGVAVRAPRKISCPGYGHPSYSDTKGKHMDEDCCPDPDEWPKPGCIYDAKGYSIMLSGPAKK